MRNFASTLVKFSKLSHIQTTIWRPPKMAPPPPRTAGSAGPFVTPLPEGRLPLCSTSSEAGALPSEVHIENDSDRKFSKSIFFQNFSGNHFYPRFMVRCSLLAENIFRFFEVRTPHLPIDTPFWTRGFSLVM